ncbi:S-adenosyl-L-methionine-dependent methyltransferase [Periconia macrospinosa]|uniref:S-adenosyl-L-methionine-dependent methyltransferase n=1 Tax=Periconia macrospinosa TaxID=97972 RepID=A0A2V1DET9_9PLEO|nr:S-adenosyl-L-methionine-dependent methyltransferase [Periconia macrospinosa]
MSLEIEQLANAIASNVAIYKQHLSSHGIPAPSHSELPPEGPITLPPNVENARQAALEASHELHDLLSGSVGHIMNAAQRSTRIMVLHFIHTYKIGYNLKWGSRTTFNDIADLANLDVDDTKRMLRLAMTEHLFTEPENGIVMHTAASYELARNHLLSAWVGITTQENWSPMLRITEAMGKYPGSEEPLESAYVLAHGVKEDAFKVWEKDPARITQFSNAMAFLHAGSGFQPAEALSGFAQDTGVFVDVGGSKGHVSIQLARTYPKWKFIVQDSKQTVQLAREEIPDDVREQVSFQVHDFWTEQPVKDADVYFFKTIFHDWSDKYSIKLLRALIPSLKQGAKVIIADVCIPPKGAVSQYKEQWMRGLDIVMKCFTNARERDYDGWASLFEKADARFRFLGVRTPLGSKASFIEAEWNSHVGIINGN